MSSAPENGVGGFTALFVRRPILAVVVNLLILVGGLAALFGIEIRELPEVDSPVVTVMTFYEGASPETIDREVTARIEGAAGRVSGVRNISSSSNFGRSRIVVEFDPSVDINVAATDLKDAVSQVQRDLPDEADDPRIVKADDNSQPVLRIAVTSDRMAVHDITELVEDVIVDRLSAVPGVADVSVFGDRDRIFRVDVDQAKLASRGLTVADIAAVLGSAAFDAPTGSLTSRSQELIVRASAAITTPEAFEATILRGNVRLGDVASVSLGADIGQSSLRANSQTGVGLGIVRQPGSNTVEISGNVRGVVEELRRILPEGVDIRITSDDATFISQAIYEVMEALGLAMLIVVAVIFLFLVNLRATVIPAITLPVALIGSMAGIWIAGMSVNILTLLALVIATGLVVDDAIIVLENIVTQRNRGLGPRAAAVVGTRQVFFAVLASTATLAAVFIPIAFLPGKVGGLFREFGFTLTIAVLLSGLVALSLCPMLASRFLTREASHADHGVLGRIGRGFAGLYRRILRFCLDMPLVPLAIAAVLVAVSWTLYNGLRYELTPSEDRSLVMLSITAPQGVSLDHTLSRMSQLEEKLTPMIEAGEIRNTFSIAGWRGQMNSGFLSLTLAPWDERQRSQQAIAAEISRLAEQVPGVRVFTNQTNSLGIRGAGSGLQFALAGDDYDTLAKAAEQVIRDMEDDGRFGRIRLSYETTQPQLTVSIDRERASLLGINIEGLAAVMQAMLDGRSIGTVFVGDQAIEVKLVSTSNPVNDPTDLENIFIKAGDGRIVPLSAISTLEERAIAPSLSREQKLRAVSITASLDPDFSLGNALVRAGEIAAPYLPAGGRIIPLAEAATLEDTSSTLGRVFMFAAVVVLLVLAAQFESFVSALIILFTVPLGLAFAAMSLWLTGVSLNVYSQIGLILLVGIMAKNGILIVEFANQLRDEGASVREAVEEASIRRLRPVLMTMIATIVGALPLVLASGAGAEARMSLGWVIVGGLGLAVFATLFLTPVAFQLLAGLSKPRAAETQRLREELERAA